VTSSSVIASNALLGSDFSSLSINSVIGVAKAYTTRVGEGPFPTELNGKFLNYFRNKGGEFGATTGRPRRCGWLDLVLLKRAIALNGITELVITKLDILTGLKKIKVCLKYKSKGQVLKQFPYDLNGLEPVYKDFKGWDVEINQVRKFSSLPQEAKEYIKFIERFLNLKVKYISVGEKRKAIFKK
jgi:adenylosuccinate synthase